MNRVATGPVKNPVGFVAAVRDFIFPPLCIICDSLRPKSEPWLCTGCLNKLRENNEKRKPCASCGQNLGRVHCSCTPGASWNTDIETVFALFDFSPTVKDLLHQVKYRGKKSLAVWTGSFFGDRIPGQVWSGVDVIVPVPLHKKRELKRGYNQSRMFAKGITVAAGGIPLLPHAVTRTRNTVTQTALNRDRRAANIEGAFSVPREMVVHIRGKRLLLVDDVVTTGVTTREVAKALRAAGCAGVKVLCIARD